MRAGSNASCRPGLIACNSRHFDEAPDRDFDAELLKWFNEIAAKARRLPLCSRCAVVHVSGLAMLFPPPSRKREP